jgi:photosystem II stability/assembly factor-like uncharacterized protein
MKHCIVSVLFALFSLSTASAQIPQQFLSGMKFRSIGPYRGGRSLACTGIIGDRKTYYFGATGGGIWKTIDAGETWLPCSDTTMNASSIGAIAVAQSDASILFAGTGECDIRGNISFGEGIYKSTDAGVSWKYSGLREAGSIAKISIHPKNSDEIIIASMGHVFGSNPERGIFKSIDGGNTWKKVLSRSGLLADSTGAIDIQRDPFNPKILYASLWQAYRNAYSMSSGGAGSGLFTSLDGGETWKEITKSAGLPVGINGKIRIACSPAQKDRIWAMIENEHGGLFRSDDAGYTWKRVSEDRQIRQRPWYFSHIIADPKNPETIYALNVGFYKSTDGGRTFQGMNSMHGDHHDMWIDPLDPERFILADDGGAVVTNTGGSGYTELDLPTAQFYHVTADNQIPYRIYGCQQDNSSVGIASRSTGWAIGKEDWFTAAGGESGYIAVDPLNSDIIYGGNYGGFLSKLNRKINQDQDVSVYPENVVGCSAETHQYRFQWTYPIVFSKHDKKKLYVCGNHVFASTTGGNSWDKISPDLTTNDKSKQKASGGIITKDNTGVETYCTIFAFAESPVNPQVLWTGSDDGLVYITTDGGSNWKNVTPSVLPNSGKPALISIIEAGHFEEGTAYIAATRYKSADDQQPYLLKTTDYGASWKLITNGIQAPSYTRVIREDPVQKDLLYAGTETGLYISVNGGNSWQSFQQNVPRSPIHDIVIHEREHDLILATHGRSFWLLDDIIPLRYLASHYKSLSSSEPLIFTPRNSWRMDGGSFYYPEMQIGQNLPNGVMVSYYIGNKTDKPITLEFYDQYDSLLVKFSSDKTLKGDRVKTETSFYADEKKKQNNAAVSSQIGFNRFTWNMRMPDAKESPVVLWGASNSGPKVVPGTYSVSMKIGDSLIAKKKFIIESAVQVPIPDLQAQYDLHMQINKKVTEIHETIERLRDIKKSIQSASDRIEKEVVDSTAKKGIISLGKTINDTLSSIEEELIQTKAKAGQDLLNYPMKLNNKLAALTSTVSSAESAPTAQTHAAVKHIITKVDYQLEKYQGMEKVEIKKFNDLYIGFKLPAIAPIKPSH